MVNKGTERIGSENKGVGLHLTQVLHILPIELAAALDVGVDGRGREGGEG